MCPLPNPSNITTQIQRKQTWLIWRSAKLFLMLNVSLKLHIGYTVCVLFVCVVVKRLHPLIKNPISLQSSVPMISTAPIYPWWSERNTNYCRKKQNNILYHHNISCINCVWRYQQEHTNEMFECHSGCCCCFSTCISWLSVPQTKIEKLVFSCF